MHLPLFRHSQSPGSSLIVAPTGTLMGSGTIHGHPAIFGTVAPGTLAPGTLTTASASFESGGVYELKIGDAGGTAGNDWDLLEIVGTLAINADSDEPFTIHVTSAFEGGVTNFAPMFPSSYTIVSFDSIVGFSADAFIIDASAFHRACQKVGATPFCPHRRARKRAWPARRTHRKGIPFRTGRSRPGFCPRPRGRRAQKHRLAKQRARHLLLHQHPPVKPGCAKRISQLIRGHWSGCEIRNHWIRDAIFEEDKTRSKNFNLNAKLAILRCGLIALKSFLAPDIPWPNLMESCQHKPSIAYQMLVNHSFK